MLYTAIQAVESSYVSPINRIAQNTINDRYKLLHMSEYIDINSPGTLCLPDGNDGEAQPDYCDRCHHYPSNLDSK